MYPSEVNVNQQNLDKLIDTYTKAHEVIVREITTATDWGVQNRKKLLAQIDAILAELQQTTQTWIDEEIPAYYASGASDAIKQLNNIGAEVKVAEGFNKIHKDAILGLIDETSLAFAEGLAGVSRSGQLLLGRITREGITQKLAEGMISGQALREVRQQIKGQLVEQGLAAIVDRGGNSWTLDRYADMLFRTKLVETRNRGISNRLVENGYDLVQVSSHFGTCPLCAPFEGQILSTSGASRGYPTVIDAQNAGLFHPNCRHAINVLTPRLAVMTRAYNPNKMAYDPAGDSMRKPIEDAIQKAQLDKANKIQKEFADNLKQFGGKAAPPKGMTSASRKVIRDYNGNVDMLKDGNRGYILLNNPWDKQEFEDLKKQVGKVYSINESASKNKLDADTGYAYAMLNVNLPDGRLAEIQVSYKEMWTAKMDKGEDLYKKIQFNKDVAGKAEKEMFDLYQKAYESALARIGMG